MKDEFYKGSVGLLGLHTRAPILSDKISRLLHTRSFPRTASAARISKQSSSTRPLQQVPGMTARRISVQGGVDGNEKPKGFTQLLTLLIVCSAAARTRPQMR